MNGGTGNRWHVGGTLNGPVSTQSLRDHESLPFVKQEDPMPGGFIYTATKHLLSMWTRTRQMGKGYLSIYPLSNVLDVDKLSTFSFTKAQKQSVFHSIKVGI